MLHHAAFADAGGAQHEQVVALLMDAGAEADRVHRAHLADDLGHILQVGGGLEAELFAVAGLIELSRRQSERCIVLRHGCRPLIVSVISNCSAHDIGWQPREFVRDMRPGHRFSLYSASTTLPRGPDPLGRGSPPAAPTVVAGSAPRQRVSVYGPPFGACPDCAYSTAPASCRILRSASARDGASATAFFNSAALVA